MTDEREGGDITASDMILPEEEPSEIVKFFENSSVFVTGATGFIGKMILEKLLTTVPNIKMIYILIRPKKGKEIHTRLEEIFKGPDSEPMRRKYPNFMEKITTVSGDCTQPDLGLSDEEKQKLITEVECVIHCAATVRFDEKLRTATNINVRTVRDLLKLGKQMKKLRAMLYVSTAFSNCPQKVIDETFYDPPIEGEKLLQLVDCLDDAKLDAITPTLLGEFPNTYVFTKSVAENIVKEYGQNLPVGVYRPSIVIASVKEPVAGFIDNMYGATGVLLGAALGLLRSLQGKKENKAEMVPADYVVNGALAAVWDIASMKTLNDNKEIHDKQSREEKFEKEIPVYNFVSSPERPITWEGFTKLSEKNAKQIPSELIVWHYFFALRSSRVAHLIAVFLLHTIPAYIVDFIAVCIGKKPQLVKGYQKINKFADVIAYFSMREWTFRNGNIQALWKRMNPTDQKLFEFSIQKLNWETYFYTYLRGARVYLLKDPLDTIPKGAIKYYKVMVAHYFLLTVLFVLSYKIFVFLLGVFF